LKHALFCIFTQFINQLPRSGLQTQQTTQTKTAANHTTNSHGQDIELKHRGSHHSGGIGDIVKGDQPLPDKITHRGKQIDDPGTGQQDHQIGQTVNQGSLTGFRVFQGMDLTYRYIRGLIFRDQKRLFAAKNFFFKRSPEQLNLFLAI
jgi:hypothetical protein